MGNEERILSILTDILQRLDTLEVGQAELKAEQANLNVGQAELKAEQAKLNAGQAELKINMNSRFDTVDADMKKVLDFALNAEEANEKQHKEIFRRLDDITSVTKDNTYEIAVLKNKAV